MRSLKNNKSEVDMEMDKLINRVVKRLKSRNKIS